LGKVLIGVLRGLRVTGGVNRDDELLNGGHQNTSMHPQWRGCQVKMEIEMPKARKRNFVTCTYYVTPELHERVKRLAYAENTTVAALIRAFLVSETRKADKQSAR
jgi:hypothetical protein